VIGEAALRQRLGGAEVMRGQLRHLLEASRQAAITVRVLPYEATSQPGVDGVFSLLDVEAGGFTVVVLDGLLQSSYVEEDSAVGRYNLVFDQLRATALSDEASRDRTQQVLDELEAPQREGAR
jgi:hypothetical protein